MHRIHHLDGALRNWEDMNMLIFYMLVARGGLGHKLKIDPNKSSLGNWEKFRHYLLNMKQVDRFDWERFMSDEVVLIRELNFLWEIPQILFQWTKKSRRVYHLTESILEFLNVTQLGNVQWEDVYLPFDSYLITLARPYLLMPGVSIDSMMFTLIRPSDSNVCDELVYNFHFFSSKEYEGLDERAKRRMQKMHREKDWTRLLSSAVSSMETVSSKKRAVYHASCDVELGKLQGRLVRDGFRDVILDGHDDFKVLFLGQDIDQKFWQMIDYFMHIFVGFSNYLQLLMAAGDNTGFGRQNQIKSRSVQKEEASLDGITKECQVCYVKTSFRMSWFEKAVSGNGGVVPESIVPRSVRKSVQYRFVPRHWRRPSGQGDNPNSLRTVIVSPYHVNWDKLPPGMIPAGSITEMNLGKMAKKE